MSELYQIGRDVQSLLDRVDRLERLLETGTHKRREDAVAMAGTLIIEVLDNSGTPRPVGSEGLMKIENSSGRSATIIAGTIAIDVPAGEQASVDRTGNGGIHIRTKIIEYFNPCIPGPPPPGALCITTPQETVLMPATVFYGPGDQMPAGHVWQFRSNGRLD
jgi:hypothetical protein